MGPFSGIKDTYKKSEAAVVVQNLLEIQVKAGAVSLHPANFATLLVDDVWSERPDIFGGKFGQRPFKISVAAAAFSHGILKYEHDFSIKNALLISLGNIFSEVGANGRLYPLNSLDEQLLDEAMVVFTKKIEEFASSPLGEKVEAVSEQLSSLDALFIDKHNSNL